MSSKPYPQDVDCVWLASDREGNLAAFITAGRGPIPEAVLDTEHMPIEDVEARLCELPPVTQAQLLVSVKRPDDFVELAERGLFVYDWTDINRLERDAIQVYEPVAVPTQPITVDALTSDLAALAQVVRLSDVLFAAKKAVEIRAAKKCVEAK